MAKLPAKENSIRILSVVWYKVLPPNYGGQKAIAYFNEALGPLTKLICLCAKNNKSQDTSYTLLPRLPLSKMQFLNPLAWLTIFTTVKKQKVTHLILEFPYYGIAAFICKYFLQTRFILHAHNIEFLRFKEQGKWWWKLLFYFERWTSNTADHIFFKTDSDKNSALTAFNLPENSCTVLPFGVSRPKISSLMTARAILEKRHQIVEEEKILLFAGTLDYEPNAVAAKNIFINLVPALRNTNVNFKILICGRNEPDLAGLNNLETDRVIYVREVTDIENYYGGADIFINPVQGGGGVQTKNIEAIACNLNVVCFKNKTEGIMCAKEKLFAVPMGNWALFAEAIVIALAGNKPTPEGFFEAHEWSCIAEDALTKMTAL